MRDLEGEPIPTRDRKCLRCGKIFETEGPHNRMCHPCRTHDLSPYAI